MLTVFAWLQSAIRYAGPFGLGLVQWTMSRRIAWTPPSNIIRSGEMDFEHITQYCYHNWALKPSGDRALYTHLRMPVRARSSVGSKAMVDANVCISNRAQAQERALWMESSRRTPSRCP